uniref:ATPbinding Cassette (ABC) Superfamily putative n=1 Tax=Albugo laibachii Nc14 TaxID=890382 RepID=F0WMI3_9STRA|nr:ATPbinding Cassette (ABC) Superfamily putative [Albugo laibachii Nc14]|eukprot:CCA22515.1 ATPbinding Cassette (ABC) Superfamily putative [Albugo laibachii Nc14]
MDMDSAKVSSTSTIASNGTSSSAQNSIANQKRLYYLRLIDSRKWHYSETFALFMDFFTQLLTISFTSEKNFANGVGPQGSRLFSALLMLCYFVDMGIRILGLRSALFRSHSNVADLVCLACMVVMLIARFLVTSAQFQLYLILTYLVLVAFRLILKPRARTFSKKLHKFRRHGDEIRISIQSLRASLARIPGISALAIEMMETDLVIICGRQEGDMTRNELIQILERALHYRPHNLSATEFLSHLRDIDASSKVIYGMLDVVRSTLWHWSNQSADLMWCILVVCLNASISPALAFFLDHLSVAFESLVDERTQVDVSGLHFGIYGILGICIPFVLGDYAIGYFQSKMISKATERLQTFLLDIILQQGTNFFAERSEGDLNNLFSSDVARVNALWQAVFWNFLNPLVAVLFGFGYALLMNYRLGIMAFAFAAVLLSSGPQGFASQRSKEFGSKNAFVAAEFQNAIACQKVIRAYAIQSPLMNRFATNCIQLRKNQFLKDFWSSVVQIYIESAMYIFTSIMMASLAMDVWHGNLSAGRFFGFVTLLSRVSTPVTVLGGFMRVAIGNASSLQRLDDIILGLGKENTRRDDLPDLPRMKQALTIDRLVFRYDSTVETYVLDRVSAVFPLGTYNCIVGSSGCGKSTFLSCLMQFQDISGGCIRLDGLDVYNYSKESFMRQTAVVFQDGGILNGTIYDNIRYGNINASDEECEQAGRLAECMFIQELVNGFHTVIGQHATCNLSGGQAQRIYLARALCRKPRILLLDEATSALDPETETSIIGTLERLSRQIETTIISVTHRLSTAVNADQILVLDRGKVAEVGRYNTLIERGGLFYEMVNTNEDSSNWMKQTKPKYFSRMHGPVNSVVALQQFTQNLETRAAETNRRSNSMTSWHRYSSRLGNDYIYRSRRSTADSNNAHLSMKEVKEENRYYML